ncbi:MAG: hypothetical protein JJ895_09535 [Balneolaceae bacterium]|nr:hypothetical protein [Balneolaceae bacterium]
MKKIIFYSIGTLTILYGLLLIPNSSDIQIETKGEETPFVWNQDERWNDLEEQFKQVRTAESTEIESMVDAGIVSINNLLEEFEKESFEATDQRLDLLLNQFFELAPYVAAQANQDPRFFSIYDRARRVIKKSSIQWDVNQFETRAALYKVLFGMRATVEEVLLQSKNEIEPVIHVTEEPSQTPSTTLFGIKVHSGDLLVSRGGAEVSALISRGNDFPGNFSHVALIYVDAETNEAFLIEAHIERGVAVASAEEYMNDGKQRFMVLRPRADLPELEANPMLPHLAAKDMFEEVQERHIPYDFKMNFFDPEAMFCSEVGSFAYKNRGIKLWESESTISSKGVIRLLNTFGVENFVTQMPSDLEYDPKLSVVAEWRDAEALYEDHLYNAVIDAMLECAEMEVEIKPNYWILPAVRLVKGYSLVQNLRGKEGPVPEGMNATQALKSDAFINRHAELKAMTDQDIRNFEQEENYLPPYWEMFEFARQNAGCIENQE